MKPDVDTLPGALVVLMLSMLGLTARCHAGWKGPEAQSLFVNEANPRGYNYAPSLITENGTTDIWWCGQGKTDVIYHWSYNAQTGFSPVRSYSSRPRAHRTANTSVIPA